MTNCALSASYTLPQPGSLTPFARADARTHACLCAAVDWYLAYVCVRCRLSLRRICHANEAQGEHNTCMRGMTCSMFLLLTCLLLHDRQREGEGSRTQVIRRFFHLQHQHLVPRVSATRA